MIANVLAWAVVVESLAADPMPCTSVQPGDPRHPDHPFHPRLPPPNMPICTPSVAVTYRTIHPGGFAFPRGS
ncbi:MAG TPA: hypothetical protein VFA20_26025 [Myxococcaceae bacterium]|nr:hypothetical protein [Myxococcaceae bacterium]